MGAGIKNQIGPYMYADGAIAEKAFAGRLFKVVIAGARNAGIIGSEDNGIVVLDEDNQAIALDNHVKESTGYFGPSERQWAEFRRIMAMDWAAFSEFVREHPRYREGTVPDINSPEPLGKRPEADRIIFPASKKDPDCPYAFSLESRREILQFLAEHPVHRIDGPYSRWAYAWDVKVHSFDRTGHHADFEPDPDFDERWERYLESHPDLFWEEAADELSSYTEGTYATYPGDDEGQYDFGMAGRSGGWLILTKVDGLGKMCWDNQMGLKDWLKDLDDADLIRLYKLIVSVDKDVANPAQAMAYRFASRRAEMESEWKDEAGNEAKPG